MSARTKLLMAAFIVAVSMTPSPKSGADEVTSRIPEQETVDLIVWTCASGASFGDRAPADSELKAAGCKRNVIHGNQVVMLGGKMDPMTGDTSGTYTMPFTELACSRMAPKLAAEWLTKQLDESIHIGKISCRPPADTTSDASI
jgi:hypothetical protein